MGILEVKTEDVPSLKSISERCLFESLKLEDTVRSGLISHTAENIDKFAGKSGCAFFKFVEEDQILGYVLVKEYWNLSDLFVLPGSQGSGIGGKLLDLAISTAKKKSSKSYIWVNSSENAESFYRKHGFSSRHANGKKMPGVVPLELSL